MINIDRILHRLSQRYPEVKYTINYSWHLPDFVAAGTRPKTGEIELNIHLFSDPKLMKWYLSQNKNTAKTSDDIIVHEFLHAMTPYISRNTLELCGQNFDHYMSIGTPLSAYAKEDWEWNRRVDEVAAEAFVLSENKNFTSVFSKIADQMTKELRVEDEG